MRMNRRILVVDDDAPILEMMELLLRRLGYEPGIAADGLLALDLVRKDPPALILLDVMMTPINGWEFLEKLRADPATHDIPVLLFTAHPSVEERMGRIQDGNLGVLLKPVTLAELESAIPRFLKGK
jgi:CheY-like chemotaxis protein